MKRRHRIIAALLIFSMAISAFSEPVLAKELEKAETVSETSGSESDVLGDDADGQSRTEAETDIQPESEQDESEDSDSLQPQEADENTDVKSQENEKDEDSVAEPQKTADNKDLAEETPQEENLSSEDMDDPGRGRLGGYDVPEEFFGKGTAMRAASTSVTHDSRFTGYTIKQGIDVSKWNNTINWSNVKKAGIEFAFVRTSYRGTETGKLAMDPKAAVNMNGAAAAGIRVGAYIFSQAITKAEAVQEAEYLLGTVKGYNITMPLVFDFEYYSGGRLSKAKLSKRAQTDICLAFCDRIKEAGYTPLVYANLSMFTKDLYASEITAKYPAWLARYNNVAGYSGDYDFWQYTSSGKVSGISGNVDMNYWYIKPGSDMLFGTGSLSSSTQNSVAPSAPATPKLSGKALSYDKVKLSWKKVSGASGYALYRYNSSQKKYVKFKTISSGSTVTYTDTGRSMGKTYKYKIKAYKKANGKTAYSGASSAVSVKTDSTMTGKTNGTSVVVRSGPSTLKKALKKLGINTGVTITGTSGSWYKISLKVNGKKKTGYINKTYVTIIRKPTLSASATSSSKIKLKWDKISGASGYQIQRYNESKRKYVTVKTIKKGSTTSYTNSGLKKNKTYKYRMRSYKTVRGKKIYSYYCSAKSAKTKK